MSRYPEARAQLQACAACGRPVPASGGRQVFTRRGPAAMQAFVLCDAVCLLAWQAGDGPRLETK
jgi:hypothetical protein